MLDNAVNDMAVEELIKAQFGLQLEVKQMIVRSVPVSRVATASVFLTPKRQVFALIQAQSAMTLGDTASIAKKMGLSVDQFLPPQHDETYFSGIARDKFREVFPGRRDISDVELRYYRTLVPYNPALLRVGAIEGGVIKQFDPHDTSGWRLAAKFSYKQISTL